MKRVLQLLADSRMGLYKNLGTQGEYLRFKELLTNKEVIYCLYTAGFPGKGWRPMVHEASTALAQR